MKKILITFFIICIMICGCSKDEEKPVSENIPTSIPSETVTPEITPSDVATTQEETHGIVEIAPTEVLTADTTCVMCGRITKCTALIDYVWNSDLEMAVEKAFYLCDNCYPLIEDNQNDLDVYHDIETALYLYFSSEDVIKDPDVRKAFYTTKKETDGNIYMYYEPCVISIDSNGVHFKTTNAKGEEKIKFGLVDYLGQMYFTNKKTSGNEYKIEVVYNTKTRDYSVDAVSPPLNILLKLK